MGPIRSGHGRLGEPGISVNPGMAQEKGDHNLSVSQYQTKSSVQHIEFSSPAVCIPAVCSCCSLASVEVSKIGYRKQKTNR